MKKLSVFAILAVLIMTLTAFVCSAQVYEYYPDADGLYTVTFDGKADNEYIMEIKVLGAMPLWLSKLLNDEMVFPSPYSKYGNAYKTVLNSFLEEKESNEQFLTVNYRRNSN